MIVLHSRVIPIVLGVFGYTYGSMLGVFLAGMLTRTRGSERGNLLAMACGFVAVFFLSGLHNDLWLLFHPSAPVVLAWKAAHPSLPYRHWDLAGLPAVEFPWRIAIGTLTTLAVALLFRTPEERIQAARDHIEAQGEEK